MEELGGDRLDQAIPTPIPLTIDVRQGEHTVVTVSGDLDFPCAELLRTALASALDSAPRALTVDLERLTFVDSTGLAVLVYAWSRGRESGIPVTVRPIPPFLSATLEITGLTELLDRATESPGPSAEAATA
ncbi:MULTISPECIES: STAS domain-containing protein [unclassified Plantactinospora]|uniref:STAS domain-containing protein n=1 Tax=unclassified Plantactinospora TaxID=2631981 RepID=UPI00131EE481|nr:MULTISPECIES: STAS domain-containing protein [unclassified Plantactinospora]